MNEIQDIIFSEGVQSALPIVMSSRIRLARNLSNYKFPRYASEPELVKVSDLCKSVLIGCKAFESPKIFEIDKLKFDEKFALVESHLCSLEMAKSGKGSCLLVSNKNSVVLMINEEDHIRAQIFGPNLDFKQLWMAISEIDDYILSSVNIAYHEIYGFLTACPMNIGTAMRGSVMMHLPGLVLSGQLGIVVSAVQKLGFVVRGIYGEGSNSLGGIFQLSNQHTLGLSEVDILSRLNQIVLSVIENEELARKWLLKNRYATTRDAIGRSFGSLFSSYSMCINEAINHLSNMRLAIDLGYLPPECRAHIDHLMSVVQPAHIKITLNSEANDQECDIKRADILRKFFAKIPAPRF